MSLMRIYLTLILYHYKKNVIQLAVIKGEI